MSFRLSDRPSVRRVEAAMRSLSRNHGFVKASLREIAGVAGVSHPTVREAIGDLESRGRIEIIHRGMGPGGGNGSGGFYRIGAP